MPKNNSIPAPTPPEPSPTIPTPTITETLPPEPTASANPFRKALPYLLVLLFIGTVAAAASFYFQLEDLKANPQNAAVKESQALIEAVGRLIVLPSDEQPTIATVNDPEKLKEQAFFAQAKVGDKVLIYTNAKKAILYDPVANKILEVAPVNIGNTAGASVDQETPVKKK